ncbi:MAG: hypothetical protein E7461_02355 [Ruminococcaceae bacterium]|nr:hypothetical protein [Oscillospiraceae bacterium]
MKRMTSWLLAIALIISCVTVVAAVATEALQVSMTMSDEGMKLLKAEEGFSQYPYWDKKQYTVGYGTRCPDDKVEYYTKYGITHVEAEALLKDYMTGMEKALNRYLQKYNILLTQNQYDAIALFSYNVGSNWTTNESGLIFQAITYGATGNDLIRAFGLWCKASGQIQDYLLRRRMSEANLYLNGVYSKEPPESYGYIIFDGNGGSTNRSSQVFDSDLPALPLCSATRNGYVFAGWFTERVGGRRITKLDASIKGMTLYAQWLRSGEMENWTDTVDVTVTVTADELFFHGAPGADYPQTGKAVKKGEMLVVTETVKVGELLWGRTDRGWISLSGTDFEKVYASLPPEAFLPTEPPVTEPEVTEPAVTEPPVTEPAVTEPAVTEPEVTEPAVTEPPVTEPEVTEPEVTEPEATEPEATEPPTQTLSGKVTASSLNIRAEAGTNGRWLGYYVRGTKVVILEQKTVDGTLWGRTDKGWISLSYVKMDEAAVPPAPTEPTEPEPTEPAPTDPTEPQQIGKVTASQLNIRAEAGTNGRYLGYYVRGTMVVILERKMVGTMEWGRTDKGWISLSYVKLNTPSVPPEPTEPTEPTEPAPTEPTEPRQTGKVTASQLNIRAEAGTSGRYLGYYVRGTKVTVLETKLVGSVKWGRTDKGWISLQYVQMDAPVPETVIKTVTADVLRVRSGPGTAFAVAARLNKGTKVTILETKTVDGILWGRITQGWISMDYVK